MKWETVYLVVVLLALGDIWTSRLSAGSKVLWTLTVVFVVAVGPAAWLLTRWSAHRELDPIPEAPPASEA
jgi:hypothetical protein